MGSAHSNLKLRWLLDPVEPRTFIRDYWEKQPLIVGRSSPAYYHSLLTMHDVDAILSASSIRSPNIRLARSGTDVSPSSLRTNDLLTQPIMHDALFDEYRKGTTIILQFLHERWAPLSELCSALAVEFSAAFQTNIYITPKGSQGFAAHYDDHDVFILQVSGKKQWKVYDQQMTYLPLEHETHYKPELDGAEPCRQFELREGDCAYIPRGWIHEAASTRSQSIHITLGVNTITWAHLILRAVTAVCNDRQYRGSLPPGLAASEAVRSDAVASLATLLNDVADSLDPAALIDEAAIIAGRGAEKVTTGRLCDLNAISSVSDETMIRRRPEVEHKLGIEDTSARLYFHGKVLTFPSRVAPDLEFITSTMEFVPVNLPGKLDYEGRMVLVRRLIEEGFLQIVDPA